MARGIRRSSGSASGSSGSNGDGSTRKPAKAAREPMPAGYWPIWTTVLIDMIGFGIALPVLGIYAKDRFGADGLQVGLLGAAYSAATFLFAPLTGKLSDRIGRKPILLLSLFGTAVAATLTGLAGSIWLLILWRFVDGATGASYGAASAAIGDLAPPHRRATLLGMLGAAFGIGFTVGPALGSLLSWLFEARTPFFVLAGMSLLNAFAVIIRVPETKALAVQQAAELDATGERSGLAQSWRQFGLPILLAITALTTLAFSTFEAHFSAFGRDNLGLTKNSAGFALALVGIVSIIVQGGLIRPVTAKVGGPQLILLGALGTAVGLALFGAGRGWGLLIPSMIITAAAVGFLNPSLSAEITNRTDPLRRGAINGIAQSVGSAASVVGPVGGGLLYDHAGHRIPFYAGAALFLVSAVLIFGARGSAGRVGSATSALS